MARQRHQPRQDLLAIRHRRDPLFHQLEPPRRAHRETRPRLADRRHRLRVAPIVPLGIPHQMRRLRKHRLVEIVEHPPEVIGMAMGKDHMGHILRRHADHIERLDQFPGAFHERRPRAAVKEHHRPLAPRQRHVAGRGDHVTGKPLRLEDRGELGLGQPVEIKAARQAEMPVANTRHLPVAHRCADLRPEPPGRAKHHPRPRQRQKFSACARHLIPPFGPHGPCDPCDLCDPRRRPDNYSIS